jgi:isoquinoline 1-oxidoreductase beta subunit
VDDAGARAVEGVLDVVRLKYGVGVLADTPWAAFKAKSALKVTWSRKARGWNHSSERGYERFAAVAKDPGSKGVVWETAGDVPTVMAQAATIVEGEYRADYAYHAQMEPLNSVAAVSKAGDAVEVWAGTQSQTITVAAVAQALGIPEDRVKFNDMLLGGGFGRRGNRDVEFIVDSVLMSKAADTARRDRKWATRWGAGKATRSSSTRSASTNGRTSSRTGGSTATHCTSPNVTAARRKTT